MRARRYAVVDGVTYRCGPQHVSPIRLLVPSSEPQPPGFERRGASWQRLVDRSDVSRLFYVDTTATWREKTVEVFEVSENRARIEYRGVDFNGGPELILTDYSIWSGWVPVDSLTDVVEKELEYEV